MHIYRLCRSRHGADFDTAFNGLGAYQMGGRWNHPGQYAVYVSGSISLATLEILVHADLEDLPSDLVCVSVQVPSDLVVASMDRQQLPKHWRNNDPSPIELADMGSEWLMKGRGLLLQVPSAIIPSEHNYILNPLHEDLSCLSHFQVSRFTIDPRLGIVDL